MIYLINYRKRCCFLKITDIRVTKVTGDGKLRAYVSVTFEDCFVVHSFKIIEGANGLFLSMPSRKKDDKYLDTAHPITKEFQQELSDAVLAKYAEEE